MSNSNKSTGKKNLLDLLSQSERPGRAHFLSLACELIATERSVALLWLLDPDWGELALSRYTCHPHQVGEEDVSVLRRRFAARKPQRKTEHSCSSSGWALSLQENPEIQEWAAKLGCVEFEKSYPLQAMRGDRPGDCLGFLQMLANKYPNASAEEDIRRLAQCLAATILHTREQRKLSALSRLLPPLELNAPIEKLLHLATETLRVVCHAELCLAFLQESNLGFRVAAASGPLRHPNKFHATQGSLIALIAESKTPVRMRDFGDAQERKVLFGTERHDVSLLRQISSELHSGRVRSWLVAPVVVASHGIAVVVLANKIPDAHLAEAFTSTDEKVLGVVCEFLAGIIPSNQLYDAVGGLSKIVFSDSLDDASKQLFDFIVKMIPGIAAVALVRRKPASTETEIRHLGGDKDWLVNAPLAQHRASSRVLSYSVDGTHRYFYAREVPHLDGEDCLLVAGLRRSYLSEYEKKIVSFLCKELSHVLRASNSVDRLLENFIETRHAVRSGLTGVVGYIHEAQGCFQIYKNLGYPPSYLSQARFRKSLQRVALFANRTQQILEQSRFLLGQITQDSLRLGGTSIVGLVREVVNCLKIAAEDREIVIILNNNMPQVFDQVSIDRQLIEMLIFNLLDNAIKYSHRNQAVNVNLAGTAQEWRLAVADHGVFIRESDREAIFHPFIRRPTGQAATTRPGTGLGLAVSKAVAEVHFGIITVESTLLGDDMARTIFSVKIPRSRPRGDMQ